VFSNQLAVVLGKQLAEAKEATHECIWKIAFVKKIVSNER
jgi:hypothetical protein